MIKLPTLEEMLKAGMHFGHSTSRWHPKMKPYIFGSRNNIYIIDLEKSQKQLEEAISFMQNLVQENKNILFVGTKKQVQKPLKEVAQDLNMPYVVEKWLGGFLTNFPVVKRSIKRFLDLKEKQESGKLDKYTKKEKLDFEREIDKMESKLGGLSTLRKLPDALFVWDIREEETAITEARKKNIPIIAICDTNVNPELVNYPIACNDDATKGVNLVLETIQKNLKNIDKNVNKNNLN